MWLAEAAEGACMDNVHSYVTREEHFVATSQVASSQHKGNTLYGPHLNLLASVQHTHWNWSH